MNIYIHKLATYVPPNTATQDDLAVRFGEWAGGGSTARVIGHIFRKTGIQRRYSVIPDFTEPERAELFRLDFDGKPREASTQERKRSIREARPFSTSSKNLPRCVRRRSLPRVPCCGIAGT